MSSSISNTHQFRFDGQSDKKARSFTGSFDEALIQFKEKESDLRKFNNSNRILYYKGPNDSKFNPIDKAPQKHYTLSNNSSIKDNKVSQNNSLDKPQSIKFPIQARVNITRQLQGVNNQDQHIKENPNEEKSNFTRTKNCASCMIASLSRLSDIKSVEVATPDTSNESEPSKLHILSRSKLESLGLPKNLDELNGSTLKSLSQSISKSVQGNKDFLAVQIMAKENNQSQSPGHVFIGIIPPGNGDKEIFYFDPQSENTIIDVLVDSTYKFYQASIQCRVDDSIIQKKN